MILLTKWAKNPFPLTEYPRPQMKRDNYKILNGMWDYAFSDNAQEPDEYNGKILVPYSPECAYSGVGRVLEPDEYLHLRRLFRIGDLTGKRLILHFEAVDYEAEVFVNGREVAHHVGGYLPFEADITDAVFSGQNMLHVVVSDPTDTSDISRGKQKLKNGGMFYQCQSGIWQTVWMEEVPRRYIRYLKMTPLFDDKALEISVITNSRTETDDVECVVHDKEYDDQTFRLKSGSSFRLSLDHLHPWSPEDPFLYGLTIRMGEDKVESYFAMRKFSSGRDRNGIPRFFLNNRPYLLNGVLDQGYWPESLMTPPSDEALIFDITKMKELGFNMLRKHVKVESRRFYYHCDRLGMIVFQDMVNGGSRYDMKLVRDLPNVVLWSQKHINDHNYRYFGRSSKEGREEYRREMLGLLMHLHNSPCVAAWTAFNEGWGQFDAAEIAEMIKRRDPSRLVDHASGWFDQGAGDFQSLHNYFLPVGFKQDDRITALTEYGGTARKVRGHVMREKRYGYGVLAPTEKDLTRVITRRIRKELIPSVKKGLSVLVYTQLSDIEEEINGLYTFDRKVLKVNGDEVRKANKELYNAFNDAVSQPQTDSKK